MRAHEFLWEMATVAGDMATVNLPLGRIQRRGLAEAPQPWQTVTSRLVRDLRTWAIRIRLPRTGHTVIQDTTVQARTAEQARRLVRQLYGPDVRIMGQPRRLG